MRINRFLARCGLTSRRKAEEKIKLGLISVNGQVVTNLATEVDPKKDVVRVSDHIITLPELKYLMLNKPKGYVTTKEDVHAKKIIFELLPNDNSLVTVGRLDKDSQGLIIVTNDGDFAQNITHPNKKIEKEYIVELKKPINDEMIEKLRSGIKLSEGKTQPAKVTKINPQKLNIIITEGRNRQVRRMIAKVENSVKELTRVRIGNIKLDVPTGKYRTLTKEEVQKYV